MQRRRLLLLFALAILALDLRTHDASAQLRVAPLVGPTHASARAPRLAPARAMEPLPPQVRPDAERSSIFTHVDELGASDVPHAIERLSLPPAGAADADLGPFVEIEFTTDLELEAAIRRVLDRWQIDLGHVVVMDAATGAVFAYVSTDPQAFPATRVYPTASLMKVVTAAAVLQNAPEAATRNCRYLGSPYVLTPARLRPPARGGRVDSFWRALALSNNQCFARLAVDEVGTERLFEEMARTGLLDVPGAGHPAGRVEAIGNALDLGNLGSGLAGSYISPLAAARLAAVLATGEVVTPHWVSGVWDARGRPLAMPERAAPRRAWPRVVADELRQLMVGVTARGTAKSAFRDRRGNPRLGSIEVSGKTGSLSGSDPPGRYTWFAGIAPADAPRIAVAAVVVHRPRARGMASHVSADVLYEIFCGEGDCAASTADGLYARASARAAVPAPAFPLVPEPEPEPSLPPDGVYGVADLDEVPRPLGVREFDFPRRLLARRASGKIVLWVDLSADGEVKDVQIASSDLPRFEDYVLGEVKTWKFTAPSVGGHPVEARAKLPIPISVR